MEENVVLTVPAQRAYLLVIRMALGGVALVNDLDVDTLDDLRIAAAKESVEITLEEELHIDCVKAFVERDLLDVNETAENLAFTRSNAYRPV